MLTRLKLTLEAPDLMVINKQSNLELRKEVARQVDKALGGHASVSSVYVFGSVAAGHLDDYSDLDISIVTRRRLPLSFRGRRLGKIGTGWRIDDRSEQNLLWQSYDLGGLVDGVQVEVHYQAEDLVSNVLDQVAQRGALKTKQVPFRPYTLAALVQRSWVLRDKHGVFQRWREATATYPVDLKRNIIRHFSRIHRDAAEELASTARRDIGPT